MERFENPDKLPLEDLKLKVYNDGVVESVSALNKKWVEERYFLHYEPPKLYADDDSEIIGAKERWMEITGYLIDDCKWLLGLPFYRFWSNIVYNTSIMDALVSFLQEAPPFYALDNFSNDPDMLEQLEVLRKHVLVVFARLVTNKENPMEYMGLPYLGKLLYDNYIFTVPIIFDLCQLYGRENSKAVERILSSLFTLEPRYKHDLQNAIPKLMEALEVAELKFADGPGSCASDAVSLSQRGFGREEMTLLGLKDMIIYLLDISSNVTVLLNNYPPASKLFHREQFMNKVLSVYENTLPEMYKRLEKLANNDEHMPTYMELKHRLDVTRVELINSFRIILHEPIAEIEINSNKISEAEMKNRVDEYMNLLSNAISEKEFITDYNRFYPVEFDLSILSSLSPEVDTIKCDYLLQSIYAIIGDESVPAMSNNRMESISAHSYHNIEPVASCSNANHTGERKGSPVNDSVQLASLVSEVKDILSDLGEGFIEMCLKHYNNDSATVINAILEGNLPPHLDEIDRQLPRLPPDPMEASSVIDSALGIQRLNIFDNDEFDVMTRDSIDMSKVYNGKKKEKYKNHVELLNDKTEVKRASEFYNKYSIVADYEYNDEYDDTYDSHDVCGPTQDDAEVDSRAFTTPRVLLAKQKRSTLSDEESETEDNAAGEQNGRDQFCRNPAELRAKAEQRRQAAQGKRGSNVVGKPKGHGQDKEVTVSRDQKNTHKASRANHNRRSGAQWKRKQGMVPS